MGTTVLVRSTGTCKPRLDQKIEIRKQIAVQPRSKLQHRARTTIAHEDPSRFRQSIHCDFNWSLQRLHASLNASWVQPRLLTQRRRMQALASSACSVHAWHSRAVASGLHTEFFLAHQHRRLRAVRAGAPAHSLPGATCCPLKRRLQPCRAAAKDTKDTGGPPGRSTLSRPPCSSACGRHGAIPLQAPPCHKLAGVAGHCPPSCPCVLPPINVLPHALPQSLLALPTLRRRLQGTALCVHTRPAECIAAGMGVLDPHLVCAEGQTSEASEPSVSVSSLDINKKVRILSR